MKPEARPDATAIYYHSTLEGKDELILLSLCLGVAPTANNAQLWRRLLQDSERQPRNLTHLLCKSAAEAVEAAHLFWKCIVHETPFWALGGIVHLVFKPSMTCLIFETV